MYQGNQNLLHQKWLMGGGKRLFRLFYQTPSLNTSTTLMNLDYSMNAFQIEKLKSHNLSTQVLKVLWRKVNKVVYGCNREGQKAMVL